MANEKPSVSTVIKEAIHNNSKKPLGEILVSSLCTGPFYGDIVNLLPLQVNNTNTDGTKAVDAIKEWWNNRKE